MKKLSKDSSKQERIDMHKVKMAMKKNLNEHNREHILTHRREHIFANLSQNHPDYGDTPTEHERRKNNS